MATATKKFSLPQAFVEFHLELLRQRERVASGSVPLPKEGEEKGSAATAESAAAQEADPRDAFKALFKRQAATAEKVHAGVALREAHRAMAVRADEVFTSMVWPGQDAWQAKTLEQEIFGTAADDGETTGGDLIYARIDQLLAKPESSEPGMAEVYLLLLSLGFRGRFKGPEETSHIEKYRSELYSLIYGADAKPPHRRRLFPEAYEHTTDGGSLKLLQGLRGWLWAFAAVLVLLLVASQLIWNGATAGLEEILEQIGKAV